MLSPSKKKRQRKTKKKWNAITMSTKCIWKIYDKAGCVWTGNRRKKEERKKNNLGRNVNRIDDAPCVHGRMCNVI